MRLIGWIKDQFYHLLPPFLFFFVAFNLLNITEGLRGGQVTLGLFSFMNVLVGSIIVAKVLIVIDNLPWVDIFPKRPLIYNILWKTWIYGISAFIFRLIFRFLPEYFETKSFSASSQKMISDIDWLFFLASQCWYFILFFVFVCFRELIYLIGTKKVKEAFFG